jgi:hypothetical protein
MIREAPSRDLRPEWKQWRTPHHQDTKDTKNGHGTTWVKDMANGNGRIQGGMP